MIAGIDWDFYWSQAQLRRFAMLWSLGYDMPSIADKMSRKQEEVAILVMDLANRNLLPKFGADETEEAIEAYAEQEAVVGLPSRVSRPELYTLYYTDKLSILELAKQFNVSKNRIRQILQREHEKDPVRWPILAKGVKRSHGNGKSRQATS